jgi:plasmid stability protein
MPILSIRNLDEEAMKRLKIAAREEGVSVNRLVLRLIETAPAPFGWIDDGLRR